MKSGKNQKGFTLIEVVVVIVILAILAAIAIPRYLEAKSKARRAVILGVEAALQSAVALVKAQAKLQGKQRGTESTITLQKAWGGTATVAITEELVPKGTGAGIGYGFHSYLGGTGALDIRELGRNVGAWYAEGDWNYVEWRTIPARDACVVRYSEYDSGALNGTITITTTLTGC